MIPLWGKILVCGPLYITAGLLFLFPLLLIYFIYQAWKEREWWIAGLLLFLEWVILAISFGSYKGWFV